MVIFGVYPLKGYHTCWTTPFGGMLHLVQVIVPTPTFASSASWACFRAWGRALGVVFGGIGLGVWQMIVLTALEVSLQSEGSKARCCFLPSSGHSGATASKRKSLTQGPLNRERWKPRSIDPSWLLLELLAVDPEEVEEDRKEGLAEPLPFPPPLESLLLPPAFPPAIPFPNHHVGCPC